MKATVKACWQAWCSNIGRSPVEGEQAEFTHLFGSAEPTLLRKALDEFFSRNPDFPKLPGLRATLTRLQASEKQAARPEAPACRLCGGKGVLPSICADRDGDPVVRFGAPCSDCVRGEEFAHKAGRRRAPREYLQYWAEFCEAQADPRHDNPYRAEEGYALFVDELRQRFWSERHA